MVKSISEGRGVVIRGPKGRNKATTMKYLALLFGRFVAHYAMHGDSNTNKLWLALSVTMRPLDFVCFKLPVDGIRKSVESDFFQQLTLFKNQVQKIRWAQILFASSVQNYTPFQLRGKSESTYFQRIVFVEPEPERGGVACKRFQIGRHFRAISAAKPDHKSILKKSLQGYGMVDPSVRIVQSVYVISRLTSSNVFSSDEGCMMNIDVKKMYKKANILREIRWGWRINRY